jgi:SAM-dependent methyltransferase
MAQSELSPAARVLQLLNELGVRRAHLGSGYALDAVELARGCPEVIASVVLVSPFRLPSEPFSVFEDRVLLYSGDRGPNSAGVSRLLESLPRARSITLHDYADAAWSDVIADRRDEIGRTMLEFLDEMTGRDEVPPVRLAQGEGAAAGIAYRVRGAGPPLLLLPISLARSQWDPLVEVLAERYTVITLGGAHLGMVPNLEDRMRGGYRSVVGNVVDAARPVPGESIVEVGCGSGAVARWLAEHTRGANPITALDVNSYLLREAAALTTSTSAENVITYREGDAEAIPLPSDSVDVTVSFTVMEEVDADRMLTEMVRVTRPGGRVGVVVRATDMAPWFNLDLPPDLRQAVAGVPGAGADERGCSDASLYRRFVEAGLRIVSMGPQLGAETGQRSPQRLRTFVGRIAQGLPPDQSRAFRDEVRRSVEAGTMVWGEPYHCAVGQKA